MLALSLCLVFLSSCRAAGTVGAGQSVLRDEFVSRTMSTPRAAHTATLLKDGRLLIVGGFAAGGGGLATAEIYDPRSQEVRPTGNLGTPRLGHTATLLEDGKVLIAGGFNGEYLDSTEIFDPVKGKFTPGEKLTLPRSEHTATTLDDGTVLFVGGVGTGWTFLAETEIFTPATGKFTSGGKMTAPRESHTATLLKNGRVLITGGHRDRRSAMTVYASTEIFDPKTNKFSLGPEMTIKRHKHAATLLPDGNVLIVAGADEHEMDGAYTSVEMYDARRGQFKRVSDLQAERYKLSAAVFTLKNGKVLIAGGSESAEIFDAATGVSKKLKGDFGSTRLFSTATLMNNGMVAVVGGYDRMRNVATNIWLVDPGEQTK